MIEELLFPEIKKTPSDILNSFPKRDGGKNVTRIAPSPTGFLHIGAIYSTLLDNIVARKNDGVLFLRIEDTDQKREIEGAGEKYVELLGKFGFEFNEGPIGPNLSDVGNYGPYIQSKREEIYKVFIKDLVKTGLAYPCFLSEEEITSIREIQEASKVPTGIYKEYSPWRNASYDDVKAQIDAGNKFVIRFKSPGEIVGKITVKDLIKGDITIGENFLDIVIMKLDGIPTYHFAHLVDDYLMGTTHVIRGDEWFPSLPLHNQLFDAMNWEKPNYAHYGPLVKLDGESKRKISKRKDLEADVEFYFKEGYLPNAIIDFLANLLNSGFEDWRMANLDKNYLDYDFKLDKVGSSGALVDMQKLNWFNQLHIKNMPLDDLYEKLSNYLKDFNNEFYENYFSKASKEYNLKIINELKTRLVKFEEFESLTWFFYKENEINQDVLNLLVNPKMKIDDLQIAKSGIELTLKILNDFQNDFESVDEVKNLFVEKIKEAGMKNGQVLWPVRVALTSEEFSVGTLELIYILGTKKSIIRLENILKNI